MAITRFEDIEGWIKARELTSRIYSTTQKGDFSKDFELKNQIRGASGSIMHNIAEGFDGGSNSEFIRFLGYSQRSCSEVQSELYVALDQIYISREQFNELYEMAAQTRAKIGGFISYLLKSERIR